MKNLIKEADLFTRNQWIDMQDDDEIKEIRKKIPVNTLAVNSEADGKEKQIWDSLAHFFGEQVFNVSCSEVTPISMLGTKAFTSGEMTWTIFIAPADLRKILETIPQPENKNKKN